MSKAARVSLVLAISIFPASPALAEDCEIITATHSAWTKGEALIMSQALAAKSVDAFKAKKGWSRLKVTAQQVEPNPFFKKWRKEVPDYALEGSYVTPKTYSVCFTGVSVPFVCTSGSKVCPN